MPDIAHKNLRDYPALRRFFSQGFVHVPKRDAPKFDMICLETEAQTLFVVPETGYVRTGRISMR